MRWIYDHIKDIGGDVVECGLGKGGTLTMLALLIGTEGRQPSRKLYGFDSFQGWPEPDPSDASPRNPTKGEWTVSEELVVDQLTTSKIYKNFPWMNIQITKGFLGESLPGFDVPSQSIALVHLDVDLYEGYRDGLQYLFPKISKGGIIMLDEYKELHPENPQYQDRETGVEREKWPGCTKAVDEFLAEHPDVERKYYPPTNKYYLVKQ
ncbi:MAG TPA: TylF/MycF/NovP-related O-methyltransferase [Candidatus Paceibacterota bacterium]